MTESERIELELRRLTTSINGANELMNKWLLAKQRERSAWLREQVREALACDEVGALCWQYKGERYLSGRIADAVLRYFDSKEVEKAPALAEHRCEEECCLPK